LRNATAADSGASGLASSTAASSPEALVAALHRRVRSDVDVSKSALIFKKLLEDQLSIELLPDRKALGDATREPGNTVVTPSVTLLRRLVKMLGSTTRASSSAAGNLCLRADR
jgi:hypothetical protein